MNRQITNIAKKIIPHDIRIFIRKFNWKTRYLIQSAFASEKTTDKVYCPIAEKDFPFFLRSKNHLLTPVNGAKSRQRLVWLFMKKELDILKDSNCILHIAPELPYIEIFSKEKKIDYHPGDKMVDGYSNQKGVKNIDLTDLEYDSNSFDFIICNHVLEHIPNDKSAMSEMFRVLKKNGIAVITIPINEKLEATYENEDVKTPEQRKKHFGQWDHVRWYSLDVQDRLESVGFNVEMIRYAEKYSAQDKLRYGLSDDIVIKAMKTSAN